MELRSRRSNFSQFSEDLWCVVEHSGTRIEFDVYSDELVPFALDLIAFATECLEKRQRYKGSPELENGIEQLSCAAFELGKVK